MPILKEPCPNMNHGRFNAPVRYCPNCSKVLNARITHQTCSEKDHARRRRERHNFCADCGEQLIE